MSLGPGSLIETASRFSPDTAHRKNGKVKTTKEHIVKILNTIVLAAALGSGLCLIGCETSHTTTDKPGLMGGNKHEETTTTKNPITGDVSTTHTEVKTP